jgi:hypothetical protein
MRRARTRKHEPVDIDRRSAVRRLLMIPAGASGLLVGHWSSRSSSARTVERSPAVFRGYVAGFQFHEGPELLASMSEGDRIRLVREPGNRHDRHAVRIEYEGRKIGYVPATVSEHVAFALGDRSEAPGVVSRVKPDAVPWRAVQIRAG